MEFLWIWNLNWIKHFPSGKLWNVIIWRCKLQFPPSQIWTTIKVFESANQTQSTVNFRWRFHLHEERNRMIFYILFFTSKQLVLWGLFSSWFVGPCLLPAFLVRPTFLGQTSPRDFRFRLFSLVAVAQQNSQTNNQIILLWVFAKLWTLMHKLIAMFNFTRQLS